MSLRSPWEARTAGRECEGWVSGKWWRVGPGARKLEAPGVGQDPGRGGAPGGDCCAALQGGEAKGWVLGAWVGSRQAGRQAGKGDPEIGLDQV